jgi:hypothetical protein
MACPICGSNNHKKDGYCFPYNFLWNSQGCYNYDHWLINSAGYITRNNKSKVEIVWECPCNDKKIMHHFDYYNPFAIFLMCKSCHKWIHVILGKYGGKLTPGLKKTFKTDKENRR